MSVTVDMSERQLKLGIVKLGLAIAMLLVLVAYVVSLIAGEGIGLVLQVLFVTMAFGFLTNGFLAALKIIDWFEARKHRHG